MKVGIIANPVSARDIRRVVSFAANLPVNDRANIVLRILAGLRQAGVNEIVMMPENGGIRVHMMRAISRDQRMGTSRFPAVRFLDMRVTGTAEDSAEAARRMRAEGVGAIVVLGGGRDEPDGRRELWQYTDRGGFHRNQQRLPA